MNKVALVTGSSRGIGKAISKRLKESGIDVIDTYCNTPLTGSLPLDISNEVSCDCIVNHIMKHYKRIDILINNASIMPRTPFKEISQSEWNKVFQTNVTGTFMLTQKILRYMIVGNIINISSIAASTGGKYSIHYAASKAAIENLTKSLAREYAPNIRINCIAPGRIDTEMLPKEYHHIEEIPLQRVGTPNEIADTVMFILNNKYITGQVISINGGLR